MSQSKMSHALRRHVPPQESLFSGSSLHRPAPVFLKDHVTTVADGKVKVRLRLAPGAKPILCAEDLPDHGQALSFDELYAYATETPLAPEYAEPLVSGPLTFAECLTWEEPCALRSCRYRLDDDVERRTRRPRPEYDDYGNPAEELHGPRFKSGGFFRDAVMGPGDWCALRVAGAETRDPVRRLADLFDVTAAEAVAMVARAVEALRAADLDGDMEDFYDEPGRAHRFVFEIPDDDVTAAVAKRLVVPGEEHCACATPHGAKGARCSQCGRKIKPGRQALRVKGHARSKKDQWAGVVRRVPDEFTRSDGTVVRTVSAELMEPARGPELERVAGEKKTLTQYKGYSMSEMLAARAAVKKDGGKDE